MIEGAGVAEHGSGAVAKVEALRIVGVEALLVDQLQHSGEDEVHLRQVLLLRLHVNVL